jgi:multiple sugar transport system permease protein
MTQRRSSVSPHRSRRLLRRALAYAVLGAWTFVCLFPLYWLAVTSLKREADIVARPRYVPFGDFAPSLDAWRFILADASDNLVLRYFNSTVVGLTSTLLTVLLGGLAVYGLTRFRYVLPWTGLALHNRSILIAVLATRILPPVAVVLPIYMMAQYTGTLDTRFALIVTYTASNLPVAVWLLQPVFGAAATDQEEAAQLDGASHFRIFFTIAVPMAGAGIAAVGVLIFILCWNEYLYAAYLAGDRAMTLPPFLVGQMSIKEAQIGSEAEEWAHFSAATILMTVPLLACTAPVLRVLSRVTSWSR